MAIAFLQLFMRLSSFFLMFLKDFTGLHVLTINRIILLKDNNYAKTTVLLPKLYNTAQKL
jgi:hypothetical protein